LIATISGAGVLGGGAVTFLDSGRILGTAAVGPLNDARLPVAPMNGSVHTLTASFGGTAQYAPSVSPVLSEQWPASGPGFSLKITVAQNPAVSPAVASLQVDVSSLGDFRQAVELSCAGGLPTGYSCVFASASINASGNSSLSIASSAKSASAKHAALPAWPEITAAFVFALLLGCWTREPRRLLFLLGTVSFCTALGGCSGGSTPGSVVSQIVVLTVQATAASESQVTIHSAQIPVRLPASE
jgi:hypothetical protein